MSKKHRIIGVTVLGLCAAWSSRERILEKVDDVFFAHAHCSPLESAPERQIVQGEKDLLKKDFGTVIDFSPLRLRFCEVVGHPDAEFSPLLNRISLYARTHATADLSKSGVFIKGVFRHEALHFVQHQKPIDRKLDHSTNQYSLQPETTWKMLGQEQQASLYEEYKALVEYDPGGPKFYTEWNSKPDGLTYSDLEKRLYKVIEDEYPMMRETRLKEAVKYSLIGNDIVQVKTQRETYQYDFSLKTITALTPGGNFDLPLGFLDKKHVAHMREKLDALVGDGKALQPAAPVPAARP